MRISMFNCDVHQTFSVINSAAVSLKITNTSLIVFINVPDPIIQRQIVTKFNWVYAVLDSGSESREGQDGAKPRKNCWLFGSVRIRKLISLLDPDPDPLVWGADPAPDPDPLVRGTDQASCHLGGHWRKWHDSEPNPNPDPSQRYGSADPDPYQNVTNPQQWYLDWIPGITNAECRHWMAG